MAEWPFKFDVIQFFNTNLTFFFPLDLFLILKHFCLIFQPDLSNVDLVDDPQSSSSGSPNKIKTKSPRCSSENVVHEAKRQRINSGATSASVSGSNHSSAQQEALLKGLNARFRFQMNAQFKGKERREIIEMLTSGALNPDDVLCLIKFSEEGKVLVSELIEAIISRHIDK